MPLVPYVLHSALAIFHFCSSSRSQKPTFTFMGEVRDIILHLEICVLDEWAASILALIHTCRLAFTHWLHFSSYSAKEPLIRDIPNALPLFFWKMLLEHWLGCLYIARHETEGSPCIEELPQLWTGVSPNKRLSLQCKLVLAFNIKNSFICFFWTLKKKKKETWRKLRGCMRAKDQEWDIFLYNSIANYAINGTRND